MASTGSALDRTTRDGNLPVVFDAGRLAVMRGLLMVSQK
jgi:hypothetical protein